MQHTQTHRKSTPGISHQQHKEKKRKRRDELDDIDHADQVCGSDMCDEKKDEGGDHEVEESAGVGVNIEVQEEEKQPAHLTTYTMIATHTSTSLLHNNWAACLPTILSFLQWKEIMLCRSVSRDMQSASYTLQAWKYVYLRYGELAHLCAADLRSLAPLQSVHLVGCRETYPSPDLLFAHLQHLPALRTLMLTQVKISSQFIHAMHAHLGDRQMCVTLHLCCTLNVSGSSSTLPMWHEQYVPLFRAPRSCGCLT